MLFSPEELAQMSIPSPEVEAWLKANPMPPPPEVPDVMRSRANMQFFDDMARKLLGPPSPDIVESERHVTLRDGTASPIVIHRPAQPPVEGSPLIVLFFGGGFVGGSRHQFLFRARTLVKLFGAVCVCITYRLAPEHKFPTAQMDSWDHLKWIAANAAELGADPKQGFILGGSSAGASIAAVLTRRSRVEEFLPHQITGQWLEVPAIFGKVEIVPAEYQKYWLSREQCAESPIMRTRDYYAFAEAADWDPASTWYTPAAYKQSYSDMPPTYFAVDGADPLRDDGLIYEEMLKQDGVKTKLDLYPGCPHAHSALMKGAEISKKGMIQSFQGVAWLLEKEVTPQQVVDSYPAFNGTGGKTTL